MMFPACVSNEGTSLLGDSSSPLASGGVLVSLPSKGHLLRNNLGAVCLILFDICHFLTGPVFRESHIGG